MSDITSCHGSNKTTLEDSTENDLELVIVIEKNSSLEDQNADKKKKLFTRPLSTLSEPLEAIRNFTPSWFSITMGTGILSILLENFPFQFNGLHTIAIVVFLINVVLYTLFTLMIVARSIIFPYTVRLMFNHPSQSLFIGAIPMGFTTIVSFTVVGLTQHFDWAIELAFVLWIIDLFLSMFSCIVVPYYFFVHHTQSIESMNGTWLLPIVPAIVTAASGGLLANHIEGEQRGLVVLLISYVLMGMGLILAFIIVGIYFYRLSLHKLPAKEVIFSSFIPLGPLGQGAYGMIQIGSASQRLFGDKYITGLGSTAYGMGFLSALLLWGCGVWFFIVAIFSVAATFKQHGLPFNMGWWGLAFPFGAFIAATLSISIVLESMFFQVLSAIFICMLVIIWLVIVARTLPGAWSGKMFYAPCLNQAVLKQ
ncbi:tellurite resistance protein-like permease [Backusella circina FSU 941]|nr:tellurite resistance protein-like permease [Backusella circina FSU 941]